jgi:hypothetical protein
MQDTNPTLRVHPDRISLDTTHLVRALDRDEIIDLSRPAAVAEIIYTITDHPVTYSEAELAGPADQDIRFTDNEVLVKRGAIQLLSHESLADNRDEIDAVIPLNDATHLVDHDQADVIAIDASLIYKTVELR